MSDSANTSTYRVGTREALIYAALTALAAALLVLPAVMLSLVAGRFLGPKLRRLDALLILVTALVCAALAPVLVLVEPTLWLIGLTGVFDVNVSLPVVGVLVQAAIFMSLWVVVSRTAAWSKIAARSAAATKSLRNPFHKDSILPDAKDKELARGLQPSGGLLSADVDIDAATGLAVAEPGKRHVTISVDAKQQPVLISEQELGMHGMILGSTGSGKTETIKSLAASLGDLGYPVLLLDLKEDTAPGGLRDFASQYAVTNSLRFQQIALSDLEPDAWFSVFQGLGADEAREAVLSLTEFDDSYWQAINKKMLGQLINLMYDARAADPDNIPYPSMYEVGRILSQSSLAKATQKLRAAIVTSEFTYDEERYSSLISPTQDEQKSASGFGAKLTQMYSTVAGRTILRPDDAGHRNPLDVTEDGITYVGLSTLAQKDLATVISSAVLQRMSVYAAARASGHVAKSGPRVVIIDEANLINRAIVKNLLARARSAGVIMILCTQSPEDWIDQRGDDWSVMANNINCAMVMSQGSPRSAELAAQFIGEEESMQRSQTVRAGEWSEQATVRETTDYIVAPHQLRGLSIGEMILRIGKPAERVVWSTVKQRDPGTNANLNHLPFVDQD